ncbi:hypothetical protein PT974_04423 [Cladobotryum mycophilum]|uniref:Uncharacterized protein n=1 Tax=Cladobotryum mycophilum TaxID=491253 RepID=A0ABR0SW72_9HYPO
MALGNAPNSYGMKLQNLQQPLQKYPIPVDIQEGLLTAVWDTTHSKTDLSTYFEYYSKRVERLFLDGGHQFPIQDHSDLALIARRILYKTTRDEIHQEIIQRPGITAKPHDVDRIIDLCASLLAMTEIEHGVNLPNLSGIAPILWKDSSLDSALAEYFTPQKVLQADRPKIGKVLTAYNLSRISGITIKWTTNLADHLRLVDDDQAIFIFHCTGFLQFQLSLTDSLFPVSLLQETLDTIALLFPSSDKDTVRWLKTQTKIDPQLGRCGSLRTRERRLENFTFWHDRLVILKQAFDESHPKNISQWWFDRRNSVQWYTFWVAILVFIMTIFFGVVQSVEGALQVYLAYKSQ